jgi:hypothetical protein
MDYVFDGKKESPYIETDTVGPETVYGRSKLEGEHAVAAANQRHIILHTAWVYSPFGNNIARTMQRSNEGCIWPHCQSLAPHLWWRASHGLELLKQLWALSISWKAQFSTRCIKSLYQSMAMVRTSEIGASLTMMRVLWDWSWKQDLRGEIYLQVGFELLDGLTVYPGRTLVGFDRFIRFVHSPRLDHEGLICRIRRRHPVSSCSKKYVAAGVNPRFFGGR